ncbi:MAG: glycosyltransferase [bacterium]
MLIVTDSRVWSPGEGRNYRFTRMVSGLCRYGIHIDLVTSRKNLNKEDIACLRSAGIKKIITGENSDKNKHRSGIRSAIRKYCPNFILSIVRSGLNAMQQIILLLVSREKKVPVLSELRSSLLPALVQEYVQRYSPDFIMVEYIMHAYALDFLKQYPEHDKPVTMIDTHDVAFQRCESFSRHGVMPPFNISRQEEKEILSNFDIIIAIQDEDRQVFEGMLPDSNVVTCLPSCPVNVMSPCSNIDAKSLMFMGGNSTPNSEGLSQFLKYAWTDIRKLHPDAALKVYGTVCRRFEGKTYPGVLFEGYVADPRTAYSKAAIVISPVTFGSGLKIKTLEGLGYGRPVVATTHSAAGLKGAVGQGLFIAADWGDFASIIDNLLQNPIKIESAGKSASDYIARHFSGSCVMNDLLKAMNKKK